jgi:cellulose synthase/poly-beta-1,6-N-acetylglucosamine synthase-like glycosyltransferase
VFFAIAGHFFKEQQYHVTTIRRKVAVFIPAYKEDRVILESVKSALDQQYPKDLFDIVIIADSLQASTLRDLKKLPIVLIEVSFKNSTKTKALNRALEMINNTYDIAIILDADNIMEAHFITKINQAITAGHQVIQAHRIAKNNHTDLAVLDAISEEINHHLFRKGHNAIGLPCGIMGSGMAFDFRYFKAMITKVTAVGGFDKELEFNILEKGDFIKYLNTCYVYDEKVEVLDDFKQQRRRWLVTKFVYFKKNIAKAIPQLRNGNMAYINKLCQMMLPTRLLLLGSLLLISCGHFLFSIWSKNTVSGSIALMWYSLLGIVVLSFALAIPKQFYHLKTGKSMLMLPIVFFVMLRLLFKLKGANKKFIHTKHRSFNK